MNGHRYDRQLVIHKETCKNGIKAKYFKKKWNYIVAMTAILLMTLTVGDAKMVDRSNDRGNEAIVDRAIIGRNVAFSFTESRTNNISSSATKQNKRAPNDDVDDDDDDSKVLCGDGRYTDSCSHCGNDAFSCEGNIEKEEGGNCVWTKPPPESMEIVDDDIFEDASSSSSSSSSSSRWCLPSKVLRECSAYGSQLCHDNSLCTWIETTLSCRTKLGDSVRTATVALLYDPEASPPWLLPGGFGGGAKKTTTGYPLGSTTRTEPVAPRPVWVFQKMTLTDVVESTFYGAIGHSYGYFGVHIVDRSKQHEQRRKLRRRRITPLMNTTTTTSRATSYDNLHHDNNNENAWIGQVLFSLWEPDAQPNRNNQQPQRPPPSLRQEAELTACGTGVVCRPNNNNDDDATRENPMFSYDDSMDYSKSRGYSASLHNVRIRENEPIFFAAQASLVQNKSYVRHGGEDNDYGCVTKADNDNVPTSCNHHPLWMEYSGYVLLPNSSSQWKFLGSVRIRVRSPASLEDRKWWLNGLYSFVQQKKVGSSTKPRSALFGPPYVAGVIVGYNDDDYDRKGRRNIRNQYNNKHKRRDRAYDEYNTDENSFRQIWSCVYTHDTIENHESVNAYYYYPEENNEVRGVGITTGGVTYNDGNQTKELFVEDDDETNNNDWLNDYGGETASNETMREGESVVGVASSKANPWTRFDFPPEPKKPLQLSLLERRIPCLTGALTTQEIEGCLR